MQIVDPAKLGRRALIVCALLLSTRSRAAQNTKEQEKQSGAQIPNIERFGQQFVRIAETVRLMGGEMSCGGWHISLELFTASIGMTITGDMMDLGAPYLFQVTHKIELTGRHFKTMAFASPPGNEAPPPEQDLTARTAARIVLVIETLFRDVNI